MTIEEKLEHFDRICMEDAREKADKMLKEYRSGLESSLQEHKENARRQAAMQLQMERERIEREIKRQVSVGQIEQKREISARQEELKGRLFTEVRNLLSDFMATQAYTEMLKQRVKEVKEFAGQEELIIYFDPSDTDKIQMLSMLYSVNIVVSEYSFGGGMRAVIPSRNILIDHSFDTKVAEARKDYLFKGGSRK